MKSSLFEENRTVLIVDDQPANIHALANIVKAEYSVKVATRGESALEIVSTDDEIDLILLDIEMPGMDGYEVCRRLKANEQTNNIPVVFVTARDSAEDEELGFSLGAVDYISKPFNPMIVRARLRNHMNLKIKTDTLERLSMRDGLTDIPNRRSFDEQLEKEWARSQRNALPLSLVMLDIDHFKAYNDNYGHGAGDECLRRVARVLSQSLARPMDMLARYGGEEFVVLLPETDPQGAVHVAEHLRQAIFETAIVHEYSSIAPVVTISLGAATHSSESAMNNPEHLKLTADKALYKAKKSGRNQVHSGI
ncbi:diguanylate cyclase [Desulfonatronovibrio hydrogenovorans]|uniref:diguanylate cyclase n=1 Tax=Desulfonatronovibrio hydrogenovorans TaxID=53245 RepID=UPI00048E6852|nr:diguanylate cyclase [Desulfonatronovibrio hydrogenovorans]